MNVCLALHGSGCVPPVAKYYLLAVNVEKKESREIRVDMRVRFVLSKRRNEVRERQGGKRYTIEVGTYFCSYSTLHTNTNIKSILGMLLYLVSSKLLSFPRSCPE